MIITIGIAILVLVYCAYALALGIIEMREMNAELRQIRKLKEQSLFLAKGMQR